MPIYVAFLRGINVGGHALVSMAELRNALEDLGLEDVRTLLQSGNIVFRDARRKPDVLEKLLEDAAKQRFSRDITFVVRTGDELDEIIAGNPFPAEAKREPAKLHVNFLKTAAKPAAVRALEAASRGPEIIRAGGRNLYVVYSEGAGRSKLTNKLIEDKLGTRVTARNWNTVFKLASAAKP